MRIRPEIVALVLLVVLIGVMSSLSHRQDIDFTSITPESAVRSSYRTFPEGHKALYDTLRALRIPVRRQVRPYALLPERGLLVVIDPYAKVGPDTYASDQPSPMTAYEGRQLLKWLRKGNHALIVIEHHPEFLNGFLGPDESMIPEQIQTPISHGASHSGVASGWVDVPGDSTTATSYYPSPLTTQVKTLRVKSTLRYANEPPQLKGGLDGSVPLYTDKHGVVVAYSAVGEGGIFWCTSPWSFTNRGIKSGQNLDFVLALASLQPKAPVIFDEYHHGFGTGMNVWTLAPALTKLGTAQLGMAILLLLVTLAWRFGPPRLPAEERFTRSRAEYLTSMAALLERTGATHVVRERLGVSLRRELGRRLALPLHARPEQFLDANAQRHAVDQADLERILRHLRAMEQQHRPDATALWRLAGEIHRLFYRK